LMSRHPREAFPPHWEPPVVSLNIYDPPPGRFLDFLEELGDLELAPWVREAYFDMVRRVLLRDLYWGEEDMRRFGKILGRTPEGQAILAEIKEDPKRTHLWSEMFGPPPKR